MISAALYNLEAQCDALITAQRKLEHLARALRCLIGELPDSKVQCLGVVDTIIGCRQHCFEAAAKLRSAIDVLPDPEDDSDVA